jgi:hypothetical protein
VREQSERDKNFAAKIREEEIAKVKARKDAEKAKERERPGAGALPLVAALQLGRAEGKSGE